MSFLHPSDSALYQGLCVVLAVVVGGYALWLLLAGLRRSRPDLRLGRPVAAAFLVRIFAALTLGQLSIAHDLRGGDETTWLTHADRLVHKPLFGTASLDALTGELHSFLFSLNMRVFTDPPLNMLRIEMITLAVIGSTLLAAAVYELAGPRPARIAMWVLAFEPASIFFSSLLHKEPLMFFAEGAVVFGGAVFWKRGKLTALLPMILGCLVAVATRPYAGWFLSAAAAVVVLHASLTRRQGLRTVALVAIVVGLMGAFVPTVWDASSDKSLKELQQSQDANSQSQANLSLEHVDYSTRVKLITNLPQRLTDVIFKPYPWQTQNTSQRLGVLGTLVMLFALGLLVLGVARHANTIMRRAGPIIYPALFMLVSYALSAGNAGTAYRYRTHVVAMMLCVAVVLWAKRREEPSSEARPGRAGWQPLETEPIVAK